MKKEKEIDDSTFFQRRRSRHLVLNDRDELELSKQFKMGPEHVVVVE